MEWRVILLALQKENEPKSKLYVKKVRMKNFVFIKHFHENFQYTNFLQLNIS